MKQVYEDRAKTIGAKQMVEDQQKWSLEYEKRIIGEENQRMQAEQEEKAVRDALSKKNHQTDIIRQINERDREQRRVIQEKMFEERAAKLAEIDYSRRIQEQKSTNTQLLNQMKTQSSAFN